MPYHKSLRFLNQFCSWKYRSTTNCCREKGLLMTLLCTLYTNINDVQRNLCGVIAKFDHDMNIKNNISTSVAFVEEYEVI